MLGHFVDYWRDKGRPGPDFTPPAPEPDLPSALLAIAQELAASREERAALRQERESLSEQVEALERSVRVMAGQLAAPSSHRTRSAFGPMWLDYLTVARNAQPGPGYDPLVYALGDWPLGVVVTIACLLGRTKAAPEGTASSG